MPRGKTYAPEESMGNRCGLGTDQAKRPRDLACSMVAWLRVGALLISSGGAAARAAEPAPRLWYTRPAATWEEALPIGNGRLGAMVFGGVAEERI